MPCLEAKINIDEIAEHLEKRLKEQLEGEAKNMEIKIKVRAATTAEIEELIKRINTIEKEYSCACTLLEVEIV